MIVKLLNIRIGLYKKKVVQMSRKDLKELADVIEKDLRPILEQHEENFNIVYEIERTDG